MIEGSSNGIVFFSHDIPHAIQSGDKTRWNTVTLGDSIYTVKRAPELLAKINLSLIPITNAYEKHPHKQQCRNCKMYFEKNSVLTQVPNHRVVDYQRSLGVFIEGKRYNTASYLYTNAPVCVFCEQLFSTTEEILPKRKSKTMTKSMSQSLSQSQVIKAAGGGGLALEASMSMSQLEGGFSQSLVSGEEAGADDATESGSVQSIETASSFGASLAKANNTNLDNNIDIIHNSKNGLKLHIMTVVQRTNVAVEKRVYQSSEVDDMAPENSITIPYTRTSRTRREADPWWEIDLGRSYHLHSISFDIMAQKAADFECIVMLLSKPQGFETPFLDRLQRLATANQEFTISKVREKKLENVVWELPASSEAVAIRIQLRGVLTLQLNEFKAFLGDNYVVNDANESMKRTKDSYATLSPMKIRENMAKMLSPQKKREKTSASAKRMVKTEVFVPPSEIMRSMGKLDEQVLCAYSRQNAWKAQVQAFAKVFTALDVDALYEVIFKPTFIEGCSKGVSSSSSSSSLDASVIWEPNFLPLGTKYMGETQIDKLFDKEEILGHSLILHYPRCDLTDIIQRIRAMLLMIQSFGHHPKSSWVGELQWNTDICKIADDPNDLLFELKVCFTNIEEYWVHCQKTYRDKYGKPRHGRKDPQTLRGCSWSQFLIIFALFIDRKIEHIPQFAFNISPENMQSAILRHGTRDSSYGKGNMNNNDNSDTRPNTCASASNNDIESVPGSAGQSQSQAMRRRTTGIDIGIGRLASENAVAVALENGTALIPFKGSFISVEGASKSNFGSIGFPGGVIPDCTPTSMPLLNLARDPAIPPMDTRFSEYKLGNFKKRVNSEFIFPKTLSLEFTELMLEDQKARAAGKRPITVPDQDENHSHSDDTMSFMSLDTFPKIVSMPETTSIKMSADEYGAPRTCTLCSKRYSYSATNHKVLFKHIISFRRNCDPSLVSKDLQMLEQGTSMFNLMTVCGFCYQFFHPDFPGGIFFPLAEQKVQYIKPVVPDADKGPVRNNPFYDDRFPTIIPVGNIFHQASTNEFRKHAKTAIEVSKAIKQAQAEEDMRLAAAEALLKANSPQKTPEKEGGYY